jgi:hypothetical protein
MIFTADVHAIKYAPRDERGRTYLQIQGKSNSLVEIIYFEAPDDWGFRGSKSPVFDFTVILMSVTDCATGIEYALPLECWGDEWRVLNKTFPTMYDAVVYIETHSRLR